jgi:hypothetical protein
MGAPACIANAISVGAVYDANVGSVTLGCTDATTSADKVTCFSNTNATLDLLAPGARITSTGRGGGTSTFVGTSQASPHAAAAAALLLQAGSSLTPTEIETALESTGVPATDPKNGLTFPRIDVFAALGRLTAGNLRVTRLGGPSVGGAGQTAAFRDTTVNDGPDGVAETTTRFYLSLDASFGSDVALSSQRLVPPLAAGTSSTGKTAVLIPGGTVPGKYFVLAHADDADAVPETNEGDNVRAKALYVGPDLAIKALTVPDSAPPGATISISASTRNVGGESAAASTTTVYFSPDSKFGVTDAPVCSIAVPALAAGSPAHTGSCTGRMPVDAVPGKRYIIALADSGDVVQESREGSRNRKAASIFITADRSLERPD